MKIKESELRGECGHIPSITSLDPPLIQRLETKGLFYKIFQIKEKDNSSVKFSL